MNRLVQCVAVSLSQVVAFSVAAVCAILACFGLLLGVISSEFQGAGLVNTLGGVAFGLLLAALPATGAWYFFDLGWNARR